MTDLERTLTCLLIICATWLIYLLIRWWEQAEEINRLNEANGNLINANAKLKNAVRQQKSECDGLRKQMSRPSEMNVPALKQTIFIQQEVIDDLQKQIAQQKKLLNQKWMGAKNHVQAG